MPSSRSLRNNGQMALPYDIWLKIFEYVDTPKDILSLAATCRECHRTFAPVIYQKKVFQYDDLKVSAGAYSRYYTQVDIQTFALDVIDAEMQQCILHLLNSADCITEFYLYPFNYMDIEFTYKFIVRIWCFQWKHPVVQKWVDWVNCLDGWYFESAFETVFLYTL